MIYIHASTGHIAHEPRDGYLPLHESEKPTPGPGQIVVESATMREAEQFVRTWKLVDTPQPYRVSKDTIISRVTELGALSLVMSALSQQTAEQQFVWTHSAWFWSDNATLRGLCQALQLEAEVVLAPDPYIT